MRYKAFTLGAVVGVFLLALGAALAWSGHASADDPTPTPPPTPTSERPSPEPAIDKTVNGQQGPITVTLGDSVTYRWVVTNLGERPFRATVDDSPHDALDGECSFVNPGYTCEKSAEVILLTPGPITDSAAVVACGIPPWPDHCQGGFDEDYVTVNVVTPTPTTEAGSELHISIDADPDDGPCSDVDQSNVIVSGPFSVAICIESASTTIGGFQFALSYDPDYISCTDESCAAGNCLDDNPDANAGTTLGPGQAPTDPNLGSGWDCNVMDIAQPICHKDGEPKAWMACWSLTGPYTSPVGDTAFPLAVVTLSADWSGSYSWPHEPAQFSLSDVEIGNSGGVEMGSCNPILGMPVDCLGAQVGPCPHYWEDQDCDGVIWDDNCEYTYNPDQANSDWYLPRLNGSVIPGDHASNPIQEILVWGPFGEGDACDPDDDNDGLDDEDEVCSSRTDPDTDGDRVVDGYDTNPCDAAVRPFCSDPTDSDGDGFTDCVEETGYNTEPWNDDSDLDGCVDWIEIVDINGNRQAEILDVQWVVKRMFNLVPASDSDAVMDMDKNGSVNLVDALLAAKNSNLVRSHSQCAPEW